MTTPRSKAAPNQSARDFDVVVVGGGHAGVEAALAATRIGAATAVVVMDATAFGRMSCNPAIGGLAKGQLVREVDALGGEMGLCTDEAGIQFRMLNTRKGPAVRSPRAQCDRKEYNRAMVRRVLAQPGLEIIEAEAVDLVTRTKSHGARAIDGVRLADGSSIHAPAVVLTTGTFLGGKLFAGTWEREGGRYGEAGATALSRALSRLDLRLGRHKTGTPPRLDRDSIDWSGLVEQPGDAKPQPFSFRTERLELEQVSCFTTHTNARTHAIIRDNAHHSPMVTGRIQGSGPRYCPSVEDKVVRFADKDSHLIFLEPEGRDTRDVYPNGISTSLPIEVQHKFLRTIRGLEEVTVLQPGYAVEYDHLATDQIRADLQVGGVAGLFAAGQINGTSGYEEAAGQGLMAGINAVRFARGEDAFVLDRASSYLGVMIDDLCRVNPEEPYRMFTSRAEFRLLLRSDNADRRLTPHAVQLGLLDADRGDAVHRKEQRIEAAIATLDSLRLRTGKTLRETLRRPESTWNGLCAEHAELAALQLVPHEASEVEAEVKYEGYVRRQQLEVDRMQRMESKRIPANVDYSAISGLSNEAKDHLTQRQPLTVSEASRVPGVTPADLNLLLICLAKGRLSLRSSQTQ